jgi:hypothetical protein
MKTIEITKAKLKKLYYKHKTKVLAKALKISVPTLIKLLKANGIETKKKGNRTKKGYVLVK